MAIGGQAADEVRQHTTPVDSTEVQSYVAQLGAKIAAQFVIPDSTPGFTFSVVSTDDDNSLHEPLVIPGGYVFIPSHLLLAATDEAEFAGMLAQAIARETLPIAQISAEPIPVFTFVGSFMGDTVLPAGSMRRQREMELEADRSAIPAMSRAGFDPAALLRFIERVQPPDAPRSFFPPRGARIAALQETIRNLPPATYAASNQFYNIQQRLRPPPTEPRSPPSLFGK